MPNSVYKVIELIGSSPDSWEAATANAVAMAAKTLKDIRIAEVSEMDVVVDSGKITSYRTKLNLSFKVHEKVD